MIKKIILLVNLLVLSVNSYALAATESVTDDSYEYVCTDTEASVKYYASEDSLRFYEADGAHAGHKVVGIEFRMDYIKPDDKIDMAKSIVMTAFTLTSGYFLAEKIYSYSINELAKKYGSEKNVLTYRLDCFTCKQTAIQAVAVQEQGKIVEYQFFKELNWEDVKPLTASHEIHEYAQRWNIRRNGLTQTEKDHFVYGGKAAGSVVEGIIRGMKG